MSAHLAFAGVLLAAGLGGLAACGREAAGPSADAARRFEDATGAALEVRGEVRRIVATVPSLAETVVALGAGDRLVGVSAAGRLPPGLRLVPRIATHPTISAEALAALRPDLVLVDPTLSPRDVAPLRARFPTFAADSRSLDGLARTFATLGRALGRPEEGARLADELGLARRDAAGRARGARVLAVSGGDSLHAMGPGSLLHDLLLACGAVNPAAGLGRPSFAVSDETLREWAPAWILVVGGPVPRDLAARFSRVPAVADGRVVDAASDDLARAGPGTAGALRRLASVLAGDAPPASLRDGDR